MWSVLHGEGGSRRCYLRVVEDFRAEVECLGAFLGDFVRFPWLVVAVCFVPEVDFDCFVGFVVVREFGDGFVFAVGRLPLTCALLVEVFAPDGFVADDLRVDVFDLAAVFFVTDTLFVVEADFDFFTGLDVDFRGWRRAFLLTLAALEVDSSSMPNSSPRSASARPVSRSESPRASCRLESAAACWINSSWSTFRSRNSRCGCESRRAPMPYITAAACLQSPAQSGQLQEMSISLGSGNNPSFGRVSRSITPSESFPCNRSNRELIDVEQSRMIYFQWAVGTVEMSICTL